MADLEITLSNLKKCSDRHRKLHDLFRQFVTLFAEALDRPPPFLAGLAMQESSTQDEMLLTYLGREVVFSFNSEPSEGGTLIGRITAYLKLGRAISEHQQVDSFTFDGNGATKVQDGPRGLDIFFVTTDRGAIGLVLDMLEKSLKFVPVARD